MLDIPLPNRVDDVEFSRLVEFARHKELDGTTVARLAEHLANSGERLTWPTDYNTADLASTGGPASLSTIVPPFVLNALGRKVVKLGVPGRPAGAIDSLGTLPGYRVNLTSEQVREAVGRCGFAHFLADERFAPMDAALFGYRKRVSAVAVPLLAAGSLLAKKLAVGVRLVGLDVRVGVHGNFGTTAASARSNAQAFCAAARSLGIDALAFISTVDRPMQPLIGRGEALVALAFAAGLHPFHDSSWLAGHIRQCQIMADTLAMADDSRTSNGSPPPSDQERQLAFFRALEAHLAFQGSSIEAFRARVSEIVNAPRRALRARAEGILSIDLAVIRGALVRLQADSPRSFGDPAGLELLVRPGQQVNIGQDLARVRCVDPLFMNSLEIELQQAFSVRSEPDTAPAEPGSMEVVRG